MRLRGRIEIARLESSVLRENRLGDPADRDVIVYLPEAYDGGSRFPVIVVLAPFGATNHSLLNYEPWQPNVVERFDRLIERGASPPAILVMPDAMNRWGGSQFVDSPASGPYQSYIADEILAWVDRTYRTIPKREARAVVGRSSGGFGALRLALDRPELVAAVGSHAGDCAFEVTLRSSFRSVAITLDRAGGLAPFLAAFEQKPQKTSADHDAIFVIACAAAYSPETQVAFPHVLLPFDARTAHVVDEVWARWLENDPVRRVARSEDSLRSMALVYLDAGDSDEHGLHFGARVLAEALRALGVRVEHDEHLGGHRGTGYRFETSLPALARALVPTESGTM